MKYVLFNIFNGLVSSLDFASGYSPVLCFQACFGLFSQYHWSSVMIVSLFFAGKCSAENSSELPSCACLRTKRGKDSLVHFCVQLSLEHSQVRCFQRYTKGYSVRIDECLSVHRLYLVSMDDLPSGNLAGKVP